MGKEKMKNKIKTANNEKTGRGGRQWYGMRRYKQNKAQ